MLAIRVSTNTLPLTLKPRAIHMYTDDRQTQQRTSSWQTLSSYPYLDYFMRMPSFVLGDLFKLGVSHFWEVGVGGGENYLHISDVTKNVVICITQIYGAWDSAIHQKCLPFVMIRNKNKLRKYFLDTGVYRAVEATSCQNMRSPPEADFTDFVLHDAKKAINICSLRRRRYENSHLVHFCH